MSDAPPESRPKGGRAARVARALVRATQLARRHAYLALAAAALLVVMGAVDFSPPEQVRVEPADVSKVVGDAPPQDFSPAVQNPQAVQLRATLRLYPDPELPVSTPEPEIDDRAKLLSQPVVTTILGMNATIEQTITLASGKLQADVALHATPRLVRGRKPGKLAPPLSLEYSFVVKSRRKRWWTSTPSQRVHIDTRGVLSDVERRGHRIVFTVDEYLLAIDLELHRPLVVAGS